MLDQERPKSQKEVTSNNFFKLVNFKEPLASGSHLAKLSVKFIEITTRIFLKSLKQKIANPIRFLQHLQLSAESKYEKSILVELERLLLVLPDPQDNHVHPE